jgi:hypothetical protein
LAGIGKQHQAPASPGTSPHTAPVPDVTLCAKP